MICFNCGYELISYNTQECKLCGMKLPLKCSSCGSANPAHAKFCFNCGAKIGKKIAGSSGKKTNSLGENRKSVAVIFADVSGFTALSEKMDPEEVRELINDCFQYITRPVYELEGTIDKYIGDCVMILFGARYPHSDDPKRAVMCAVKMMELVKEFSRERLSHKGITLDLSIGINYGLVVTGEVGNYFDRDYTVMGDIVNTAQRLQSSAGRGVILVSESIYNETRDTVQYSGLQEITVKNKKKPVKCFSPISFKKESFNETLFTVRRETEFQIIDSVFKNTNHSRYVNITGEQGIGKTSFIKQFLSGIDDSFKKIWINCNPEYQNRINYIIANILFSIMNINPEDRSSVKRKKAASYIYYILNDYDEGKIQKNYNFISLVMGLKRDNDFQNILNSMSYNDIEREMLDQVSILFQNICRKNNFVITVDDIQWADSNSISVLKKIIHSLDGLESFFIFTSVYKVEGLKLEDGNENCTLKLERLNEASINELMCRFLNCSRIDKYLLDTAIRFTNGNPLYIKEFIIAIKRKEGLHFKDDTAYIGGTEFLSLPNTIEGLILSNLSTLDDTDVRYLQAASVAGREFNMLWIKGILDDYIDDQVVLNRLLQLNIISLKSIYTSSDTMDKVYEFNQDIVKNVIYDSILNKDKKEIHKKIGDFIEEEYIRDLSNYYEILCMHYDKAGISIKALDYCLKTAQKYKSDFSLNSSLQYFNKYIKAANKINEKGNGLNIVHAYIDMGYINTVMADYDKALLYLNKALENAELADDIYSIKIMISDIYKEKSMYSEALSLLDGIEKRIRPNSSIFGKLLQLKCSILSITGNTDAIELAKKSEEVLLRVKDYENLSETMNQAAAIYFFKGDMNSALYYYNKAYKYAETTNNFRSLGRISINLGVVYHSLGMVSKALKYFLRSQEMSIKLSNIGNYIYSSINLGILYMDKGLFDRAELLFNEALEKSGQISAVYLSCLALTNLGDLMYERGSFKKALEHYEESLDIARNQGLPVEIGVNYIGMARLYFKLGPSEQIPELLNEAYKIFEEADETACISDYYRLRGILELTNKNNENALKYCEDSILTAEQSKNDMKKLKSLRLKGNILIQAGKIDKAIKLYDESINLAEQLESDYEAAKGYYRKYNAFSKINNHDKAMINLERAAEAIKKVDKCRWSWIAEQSPEMI